MGRDIARWAPAKENNTFQFTHPVWGATMPLKYHYQRWLFQFTHPVWGATVYEMEWALSRNGFQFTHPVWGATLARLLRR